MVKYCLLHSVRDGKYSVQIASPNIIVGEPHMFRTATGIVLGEVLALGDKKDMTILLNAKESLDSSTRSTSTQCEIETSTVSTSTDQFLSDLSVSSHQTSDLFDGVCRSNISDISLNNDIHNVSVLNAKRSDTPDISFEEVEDECIEMIELTCPVSIDLNDAPYTPPEETNVEYVEVTEPICAVLTENVPRPSQNEYLTFDSVPMLQTLPATHTIDSNALFSPACLTVGLSSQMQIPTTKEKKWFWCQYCKKKIAKFGRHLEDVHKDLPEVQKFTSLPKKNPKRKKLITQLRASSEHVYNSTIGFQNNHIMVRRRSTKDRSYEDFLPCPSCRCQFLKNTLAQHFKRCFQHETDDCLQGRRVQAEAKYMKYESSLSQSKHHPFMKKVISTLSEDDVSCAAKNDEVIMFYANFLCCTYVQSANCISLVRAKIRLLGRILVTIKGMNSSIKTLEDCFRVENFDYIMKVAQNLGKFDQKTGKFLSPSVPNDIGITLRNCARACENWGLINKKDYLQQIISDFLKLMNTSYAKLISKQALICQKEAKFNKPSHIPDASDVALLTKYLYQEASSAYEKIKSEMSRNTIDTLNEAVMLLLLVFNRRRTGETEKILLKNYLEKQKVERSSDLYKALTEDEKKLTSEFWYIHILGKRENVVPVLFTNEMVLWADKIVDLREEIGIQSENQFLFANETTVGRYSACTALVKHASLCGAKDPSKLRGTFLRKQFATLLQMLDLSESDMRGISAFMGHSMDIHLSFYRKPAAAFQSGYISKALLAAITEDPEKYKGQTISEMSIPNSVLNEQRVQEPQTPVSSEQDLFEDEFSKEANHDMENNKSSDAEDMNKENIDPEYQLPMEEDTSSTCSDNYLPNIKKRRRAVIRTRWTSQEKEAMSTAFKKHILSRKYPSFQECIVAKNEFNVLKRRTTAQMKAWIQAEISRQYLIKSR